MHPRLPVLSVLAAVFALATACVKDGATEAQSENRSKAVPRTSLGEGALVDVPQGDTDEGICGCKLCAPIIGPDACEKDEDCVPDSACHARGCIARAKAKPRDPNLQCTMNLDCRSADVNRCGCVDKRCALGVVR